jgi:hypothetical protein
VRKRKKRLCGKVLAYFVPMYPTDKSTTILCNRKAGHRPPCDLIMLDYTRHPVRRVRLSNLPRKVK